MPKVVVRGYSIFTNANKNLRDDNFNVFSCKKCRTHCLITDADLKNLPRRKTDDAMVFDPKLCLIRLNTTKDEKEVRVRRKNGIEVQFLHYCTNCKHPVAYQCKSNVSNTKKNCNNSTIDLEKNPSDNDTRSNNLKETCLNDVPQSSSTEDNEVEVNSKVEEKMISDKKINSNSAEDDEKKQRCKDLEDEKIKATNVKTVIYILPSNVTIPTSYKSKYHYSNNQRNGSFCGLCNRPIYSQNVVNKNKNDDNYHCYLCNNNNMKVDEQAQERNRIDKLIAEKTKSINKHGNENRYHPYNGNRNNRDKSDKKNSDLPVAPIIVG